MACLARTVSTRASSCVSSQWSPSRIAKMQRMLCSRAWFTRSVSQETVKCCLHNLGNGTKSGVISVSSLEGFTDRVKVRSFFASRAADRVRLYCTSSGALDRVNGNGNWNRSGTVECANSASSEPSSSSYDGNVHGNDAHPTRRHRQAQHLGKLACPGCGVYMQDKDPKVPGYFKMPAALEKINDGEDGEEDDDEVGFEDMVRDFEDDEDVVKMAGGDSDIPDWANYEDEDDDDDDDEDEIDLSNVAVEEWNEAEGGSKLGSVDAWGEILGKKRRTFKDKRENSLGEGDGEGEEEKMVVCARCHALRNYGKVKDESLENLLPDFDFERVVGSRLKKAYGRRAVVLMVVDGSDFDGSFPRKAAAVLAEAEAELGSAWQEGKAGNTPRLLVVMNKIDLLPKQISPNRMDQWVRRRAKAGGVPRLTGVHLVSAFKGWGIEALAEKVKELAGARGDCWVVGAQNAGKSSLINSLAKYSGETRKVTRLTEAAVPGTTLGVLKLEGILPARARLFDTPGLLHPHQITTRLTREEQKLVEVRKELKPRTFRVKKGSTVHVGGLFRLDVVDAPSESIYMTVWASAQLPCHMGKAENADELLAKHVGDRLKPPMDKERAAEIGRWAPRKVTVSGDSWEVSSADVAVAGLGWIAIGVKGTAVLQAWTYEGIAVTTHEAMVYDMAAIFERPGFTAMKAPSKGDKKSNDKAKVRVKEAV